MSKYSRLKTYCKLQKIKVKEVGAKILSDYSAMNSEAAKKIGFPNVKYNTVLMDKAAKSDRKYRDLKHELVEMNLMEKKHLKYWPAHLKALRAEGKPYKGY